MRLFERKRRAFVLWRPRETAQPPRLVIGRFRAGNPPALVDSLNVLLLHGTMSSEMRSSIIGAVNAVAATNTLKRARTAVYLVATSSQYQVER